MEISFKATSPFTIFMRGKHAKGKIQRNNYQYGQHGQCFDVKHPWCLLMHTCIHEKSLSEKCLNYD